jgi:hypothetical protein
VCFTGERARKPGTHVASRFGRAAPAPFRCDCPGADSSAPTDPTRLHSPSLTPTMNPHDGLDVSHRSSRVSLGVHDGDDEEAASMSAFQYFSRHGDVCSSTGARNVCEGWRLGLGTCVYIRSPQPICVIFAQFLCDFGSFVG